MKWTRLGSVWAVMLGVLAFPSFSQAQVCTPRTFNGAWNGEVTLCQNWDVDEQQRFWFTAQGSLIIPYEWFLVLEQKGSTTPFRDGAHMDGFRYLPQRPTALNPEGLPIGFTKDVTRRRKPYSGISKDWLGITCAACHTNQIEFTKAGGTTHRMLIDGGPAMADIAGLMHALVDALVATRDDEVKFDRFATAVLNEQGRRPSSRRKRHIKEDLDQVIEIRQAWNNRNQGPFPYGFARLDAIGAIFNEVTTVPLDLPDNHLPADAPVSYPFLWDTPHYDRVQWNGSVPNKGAGALARNIGEVLGVFGGLKYSRPFGNRTSVDIKKLGELEKLISTLQSPPWPEEFLGAIDPEKLDDGRRAFDRFCVDCHEHTKALGVTRPFKAKMMTVAEAGTDPRMANNFLKRMRNTGKLEGKPTGYLTGERFKDPEDISNKFLGYAVTGTIVHELIFHPVRTLKAIKAGRSGDRLTSDEAREEQLTRRLFDAAPTKDSIEKFLKKDDDVPESDPEKEACYKARSLNGIWATAPYLHTGSVRTMRQLLLPASERQTTFRVGSREYDPVDMGFKDEGGFELDTNLDGNKNTGHEGLDYGNEKF
ncbi:MAG: di-heme-cytochrome C peroxidase, partial [Gammaproteobacteria bacterium]|nr:di-heme-cytochrome C peroxidase [Gammaproteobacteria bacterium]